MWVRAFTAAAAVAVCLIGLTALFAAWTSATSFPRFALAVLALHWAPGRALVAALRLRTDFLETQLLSLVLGAVAATSVYWTLARMHAPAGLAAALLVTGALVNAAVRRARPELRPARIGPEHALLGGLVVVALVPLLLLPTHWRNLSALEGGSTSFASVPDAVFHLSVARELERAVPPDVPWLDGVPLSYHYGADLVAASLSSLAGVSIVDATMRFLPGLFLVELVLAAFVFTRAWLGSGPVAVLAAALIVLGEDLSFVPGALMGEHSTWSVVFFGVPSAYSLYFFNPMLPGLVLVFVALLCQTRWIERGHAGWIAAFAAAVAALAWVKAFSALHLLAALGVVTLVLLVHRGRARTSAPLVGGIALAAPLIAAGAREGSRSGADVVQRSLAPQAAETLRALSLDGLAGSRVAARLVGVPVFLVGTLGARVLALGAVFSERARTRGAPELRATLWALVVLGIVLTLTVRVTAVGEPGGYDNAAWFLVLAKYAAWPLAVEPIAAWWASGARRRAAIAGALVVSLSFPATVQFFATAPDLPGNDLVRQDSDRLTADASGLVRSLDGRCGDGENVVADVALLAPVLALTGCHTPYYALFAPSLARASELEARRRDIDLFWDAWRRGSCRTDLVDSYRIRYVIQRRSEPAPRACEDDRLTTVFRNAGFVVRATSPEAR
jgi:hypothetical protein